MEGSWAKGPCPSPAHSGLLHAQKDTHASTGLWKVPQCPDDPWFQGNLYQYWAVLLRSPAVTCKEELRGQAQPRQQSPGSGPSAVYKDVLVHTCNASTQQWCGTMVSSSSPLAADGA